MEKILVAVKWVGSGAEIANLKCLKLYQLFVDAVFSHKANVVAPLGNMALLHYNNFIGILNSRKPVGDNYGCPALHQFGQRLLYKFFRVRVK